jgi:hypothetical protein
MFMVGIVGPPKIGAVTRREFAISSQSVLGIDRFRATRLQSISVEKSHTYFHYEMVRISHVKITRVDTHAATTDQLSLEKSTAAMSSR